MVPRAHKLKRRSRWIRQRTEQIERGMHAQLPANVRDTSRCTMEIWRKHKTDSVLIKTALHDFLRSDSVDAQSIENVGASRIRRRSAGPVLRHWQTGACDDECRSR